MTPPESAAANLQILATEHRSLLATRSLTWASPNMPSEEVHKQPVPRR
jgi:hypothetical protein